MRDDILECWDQCFSSSRSPWPHSGPSPSTWPTWPGRRSGGLWAPRGWDGLLVLVMAPATSVCLYQRQCWGISHWPLATGPRAENIKLNNKLRMTSRQKQQRMTMKRIEPTSMITTTKYFHFYLNRASSDMDTYYLYQVLFFNQKPSCKFSHAAKML